MEILSNQAPVDIGTGDGVPLVQGGGDAGSA